MKKIITFVMAVVMVVMLFSACTAPEPPAEPENEPDMYVLEPVDVVFQGSGVNYWSFIEPLGYLLDGSTWASPMYIETQRLIRWYAVYMRDEQQEDIAQFLMPGGDFFLFPAAELERTVYQYFGVPAHRLRNSEFFNEMNQTYAVAATLPAFTPTPLLRQVDEMIGERELIISFGVATNQQSLEYLLEVRRNSDGTFRYLTLTCPNGETDRPGTLIFSAPPQTLHNVPVDMDAEEGEGAESVSN